MSRFIYLLITVGICWLWACDVAVEQDSTHIISQSAYMNENTTKIYIGQTENELTVTAHYLRPDSLPAIIHPILGDTLPITDFFVKFYWDNKEVHADSSFIGLSYWQNRQDSNSLSFIRKEINTNYPFKIKTQLPLYALHNVESGEQRLQCEIYQVYFYNKPDKSNILIRDSKIKYDYSRFSIRFEFSVNVPKIYTTNFTITSLELITSKGRDFTLIDRGYADIYFTVNYPFPTTQYFKSQIQRQRKIYDIEQSFTLFHNDINPSLSIKVYDHDILSRDDIQGRWQGKLSEIAMSDTLSFDNVGRMFIEYLPKGACN